MVRGRISLKKFHTYFTLLGSTFIRVLHEKDWPILSISKTFTNLLLLLSATLQLGTGECIKKTFMKNLYAKKFDWKPLLDTFLILVCYHHQLIQAKLNCYQSLHKFPNKFRNILFSDLPSSKSKGGNQGETTDET